MGEDCLFVNVFKPSHATSNSSLPVWVYIQGGGFMSNSNANFNGTTVIEESGGDIVFVNFNYRVGALGFLASEEVKANGDLNAGLLDQRKALEWVRKYISQVWTTKTKPATSVLSVWLQYLLTMSHSSAEIQTTSCFTAPQPALPQWASTCPPTAAATTAYS